METKIPISSSEHSTVSSIKEMGKLAYRKKQLSRYGKSSLVEANLAFVETKKGFPFQNQTNSYGGMGRHVGRMRVIYRERLIGQM